MVSSASEANERPARTRMSRQARAAQILDVAEQLFSTRGFEGTSIEDVARVAGVTRPVVYAHYADKDAIFLGCVRRARSEFNDRLQELQIMVDSGAPARAVFSRGGEIFFEILENDPRRWLLLFNPSVALSASLAARLEDERQTTITRIADVVSHYLGHDAERSDVYAHAVSGVGEQLGRWWHSHPSTPRDRVVSYFTDFIGSGLGSPSAPRSP